MKHPLVNIIILILLCCSCKSNFKNASNDATDNNKSFVVDTSMRTSLRQHIRFVSDKHFSQFKTPIEFEFFSNNLLTDSIKETDFDMISWYNCNKDTIDLVAHIGEMETVALLIRFVGSKHDVSFFRAPHLDQDYFRVNKTDSFTSEIKVPPTKYNLKISDIPDTINKPIIFGHIDMKSKDYYDKRDSLGQPHRIHMKFYFRSQFRKFEY